MVIAIAASLICLIFLGIKVYAAKIYDSRSCQWANIDNIEMRAKIDIPETTDCLCEYNENSGTKQAIFTLKKEAIGDNYTQINKLSKLNPGTIIAATDFLSDKNPVSLIHNENLYFREGKSTNESYKLLYDASLGKIWVNVKYLD